MRVISGIADRMLNVLAPKLTAEAHKECQPSSGYVDCGCTASGFQKAKYCTTSSQCVTTCGACVEIKNLACS